MAARFLSPLAVENVLRYLEMNVSFHTAVHRHALKVLDEDVSSLIDESSKSLNDFTDILVLLKNFLILFQR